ncbi:gliding motility-associated C-terminal domain-containing protein [Mangrovibacterium sp.]|uniref:T9SS type B sorting domain-containing protein n=1 Tax=Mangrovibacterium sp. TaxID=1961364 RepID=UPI003562AA38
MKAKSCYFLFLGIILLIIDTSGRPIWVENFDLAEKGYWGDEDGVTVHSDMTGVSRWFLDASNCDFKAANDYVKTVSTSGGRLEALDCDGEAVWSSEWIPIAGESSIDCRLVARETGSGNNTANKYVRVYFRLDNGAEQLFETNGENAGNWGEAEVSQCGLQGDSLQIVIRLNSTYASDKVIVDELLVESVEPPLLPENLAAQGDVLINELLFNPYSDADDFVEIVNVSDKTLRTDHLFVATRDAAGELKQMVPVTEFAGFLNSGAYLLLCENPETLIGFYPESCSDNFVQVSLPSFPNDDGVVVLLNDSLEVIDEFGYSADMHHPMLADENGVSLERKSLVEPTNDSSNWASAASLDGFATPGCPNSQTTSSILQQPAVTIVPNVISPNNDGYNDYASVGFELSGKDYVLNLMIFDSYGHLIDQPLKNETIGSQSTWMWSGKRADGSQLAAGIYVLYFELLSLDGEKQVFKKSCTIVNKII